MEGLENEQSSLSNLTVTSPTSQLILQSFHCFTYVTAYYPTLLSLLLRQRFFTYVTWRPPLWSKWYYARLSRSGPGFDPRSGQVSWVRFFRGFSSPIRQRSGNFRPPRSPNNIWSSLSSILIHYGRQCPEMLTRPKTSIKQTNKIVRAIFEKIEIFNFYFRATLGVKEVLQS